MSPFIGIRGYITEQGYLLLDFLTNIRYLGPENRSSKPYSQNKAVQWTPEKNPETDQRGTLTSSVDGKDGSFQLSDILRAFLRRP